MTFYALLKKNKKNKLRTELVYQLIRDLFILFAGHILFRLSTRGGREICFIKVI